MNVLMVGVDKTTRGGMQTVIDNYLNSKEFCKKHRIIYVSTGVRSNKMAKLLKFIYVLPKIIGIIVIKRIDLIHVHMSERGSVFREGFVVYVGSLLRRKTIIHMHGALIDVWYNRQKVIVKKMVSKVFRRASRVIVLGESWVPIFVKIMGQEYKNNIIVLRNAVAVKEVNQYNVNSKNILYYGMLTSRKGIDDLLIAYSKVLDEIPTYINLMIYGDNTEYNIDEKISNSNLKGRAIYKGWLKKDQLDECFSNSIIHVLPSYHEGLPMTILETMSYGIPNISTNIAAIPEVVKSGVNGILVEPGDIQKLTDAIKTLVTDEKMRLSFSNAAYLKIKEDFTINQHLIALSQIYSRV